MKKAIIIGATSGIGKGLARLLVSKNYRVGITGRRTELLHAFQAEHPEACVAAAFDIRELSSLEEHLDTLALNLDGCDLLIISAGTGELNEALDFSIEKETLDTNIHGFTCIADWAYRYFAKRGTGHLVAITSIGGMRGNRTAPAYNASKAYQINYLEGLRQKAAKSGVDIHISDIRPGFVDTKMAKGEGLFWVMSVEKVTSQIFAAIQKRKKVAYVTRRWRILALMYRLLPRFLFDTL